MLTAILSNPNSRYNQRHLNDVRQQLAGHKNVIHLITSDLTELDQALAELTSQNLTLLGVNGGDGTIQLAITALLNGHGTRMPTLAVLPAGATNMTALDINGTGVSYARAMQRFLAAAELNDKAEHGLVTDPRRILRVRSRGEPAHYGMFFGMGAIIRGIEFYHQRIYGMGARSEWAPGMAVVRAVYGIVRQERVFSEGLELALELDDESRQVRVNMLLASTLDRLFLGMRPFWGEGEKPLKLTLVREKADRFLRAFPALLKGKPNRYLTPEAGFESFRLNTLKWRSEGRFTIDGEFYPAPTSGHLDTVGPFAFLNLGQEPCHA